MDLSLRILEYMRKVRVIVNKHVSSDHFLSPEIKGVVAEEVPTTGAVMEKREKASSPPNGPAPSASQRNRSIH